MAQATPIFMAHGREDDIVDIGRASDALRAILGEMSYQNLDDEPAFSGQNTTTEFMARVVFERIAARAHVRALGQRPDMLHEHVQLGQRRLVVALRQAGDLYQPPFFVVTPGSKMLLRIDLDDPSTVATLEQCGQAVTELNRARLIAMVERLDRRGEDGGGIIQPGGIGCKRAASRAAPSWARYSRAAASLQTSTHVAPVSCAMRSGAIRSALLREPAATAR